MKICHIITRLIIGGAQENTVLSCRGLAGKGHDVTLIAGPETGPEGSLWDAAHSSRARIISLPALRRAIRPLDDVHAYYHLIDHFRSIAPDVVHTHSSKAGILGRAAAARAGVPLIVHTIHGMSFNRTQSWPVRAVYRALEQEAAAVTDKIVTVADALIDQAVACGLAPRNQFITIRSGLEVDCFAPNPEMRRHVRAEWGVSEGEVVVGTVARLFENKGYEDIIAAMPEAARLDSRLRFVWVGDGAHREKYRRELLRLGLLDRVRMVGLVPPAEVARLMNGFDFLVHASRWEGLPRAVVQALLTGVPCVSYDNDGAPEVVIPNETGLLVPLGDIALLSDSMIRLAGDQQWRRHLGFRGRERCLHEFDWRVMVEKLESLYFSLQRRQVAGFGDDPTRRTSEMSGSASSIRS